jgi:hypothetical protein
MNHARLRPLARSPQPRPNVPLALLQLGLERGNNEDIGKKRLQSVSYNLRACRTVSRLARKLRKPNRRILNCAHSRDDPALSSPIPDYKTNPLGNIYILQLLPGPVYNLARYRHLGEEILHPP